MVNINIDTNQIDGVVESLGKYVRLDLIENEDRNNMLWFCGSLDFIKRLRKSRESEDETVTIALDDRLVNDLSDIISKYIFKEIKELSTFDDDEWMEEMASLYMQLESAKNKKSGNKPSKEPINNKKNNDAVQIKVY